MKQDLIWTLKQLNLALEQYGRTQMEQLELTPTQGVMLHYLFSQGEQPRCEVDLYQALGISKSSVSATLKALRQKGYLELVEIPADTRKKQIVLTHKAYEAEEKLTACLLSQQRQLCAGLSKQQLQELEGNLQTMLSNLKTAYQENNQSL